MTDFLDIARPLLDQLQDDPTRPWGSAATTFPSWIEDLEGTVTELDGDHDLPSIPDHVVDVAPADVASESGGADPPIEEDISAARDVYREVGIDVLAFYKSFRFHDRPPFRGLWGIFLLDAGVAAVADEFAAVDRSIPRRELDQLAEATLIAHERYHFGVDVWAFGQEIMPITKPKLKKYEHYLADKLSDALTKYDYEESLANHRAFHKLRRLSFTNGTNAGSVLRPFFRSCPEPYSHFNLDYQERAEKEGVLAGAINNGFSPSRAFISYAFLDAYRAIGAASSTFSPPPALHPFAGQRACPIFKIKVHGYAARVQPFQGPPLTEFRDFIVSYLAGKKGQRSDHDFYFIDNGEKVKFPNPHDHNVKGRELKNVLLKAGMTRPEFLQERLATKYWSRSCPRDPPKPPRAE